MKRLKFFFNAKHIVKSLHSNKTSSKTASYFSTIACTTVDYHAIYLNLAKMEKEAFIKGKNIPEFICKILSHEVMHQAIYDATKEELNLESPYGRYLATNKFDNIAYDKFEEDYL